jgi:O-antigen/teichoic acid export membrane protein
MQKLFLKGLGITLLLNLLVKPATIFMVDIRMQNLIGSEVYGSFVTTLDFTFLFSMFLDMGITNYMTKTIAQYPHLLKKYSNRLFTLRLLLVLVYVVWTFILYFSVQMPIEWLWILICLLAHQISTITVNYVRAYTGGLLKFGLDAVLSVAERSVYFVLGLCLLYGFFIPVNEITLQWFVAFFIGSSGISCAIAIAIYIKLVSMPKLHWDKAYFAAIFKKSYPYAILVIVMMLCFRMGGVLLKKIHPEGTLQVGYYFQSFRLLDACWMFGVLFGSILLPVFSRLLKQKASTTGIMTTSLNILTAGGLIMVGITVGTLEEIFTALYKEVNNYSNLSWIFLSIAFIPMCFTIVFGTLLTAEGSMRRLNQIAFLGLITMIVLNVILIPFLGAPGTAIATLVSQSVIGWLQYFEVKYRMKHDVAKHTWLKLFILTMVILSAILIQREWLHLSFLMYSAILIVIWAVVVFGLKIINLGQVLELLTKKSDDPVLDPTLED